VNKMATCNAFSELPKSIFPTSVHPRVLRRPGSKRQKRLLCALAGALDTVLPIPPLYKLIMEYSDFIGMCSALFFVSRF
jgi:hypothetical protein